MQSYSKSPPQGQLDGDTEKQVHQSLLLQDLLFQLHRLSRLNQSLTDTPDMNPRFKSRMA